MRAGTEQMVVGKPGSTLASGLPTEPPSRDFEGQGFEVFWCKRNIEAGAIGHCTWVGISGAV